MSAKKIVSYLHNNVGWIKRSESTSEANPDITDEFGMVDSLRSRALWV